MAKRTEMKINTIIDLWLDSIKISITPSTYVTYRSIVNNHLMNEIGNLNIVQLDKSLLDKLIIEKYDNGRIDGKGGLSAKTIIDISTILMGILNFAYENGYSKSKISSIMKPKSDMKEIKIFSEHEQRILEQYIFDNLNPNTAGILLCLYTGIRIGELCALQIGDIDFQKGKLRINKTMQRIKNMDKNSLTKTHIVIGTPKSNKIRYIPIPSFVTETIKPMYEGLCKDFYISTGSDNYIEPRTYRNIFKKYLGEVKIKETKFHSLRRTFATRCVDSGIDIKTLSEILGHSNVRITLNTYVHSSYELKCRQMEKLRPLYMI